MGKSINKHELIADIKTHPGVLDKRAVLPRDQIQDANNPYIPEYSYEEGTLCSECGAVYRNQHWALDEQYRRTAEASGAVKEVRCPACRMISDRYPQGIVTLSGEYWTEHQTDIINLIRNEEKRAMDVNPLERILDIREDGGKLIVETTNVNLAQRIGKRINSAHKGTIDYRWPDGDHLLRVYWER